MGDSGQLGTGKRGVEPTPERVLAKSQLESITGIECGASWSFIITVNGLVYGTGANSMGQLGLGHRKNVMEFTLIESLAPIKKVSAGNHTAAISMKNELFFWGTGVFGEILTPQRINEPAGVKDVAIGGTFGIALDIEDKIWTWGANTSGELGTGNFESKASPYQLHKLQNKGITKVICGKSFAIALGKASDFAEKPEFMTGQFPLAETMAKNAIEKSVCSEDLSEIDVKESILPSSWRNDTLLNVSSKCTGEEVSCSISQRDPNQNLVTILTRQRDYLEDTLKRETKEKNRFMLSNVSLKEQLNKAMEEINKKTEEKNELQKNLATSNQKLEEVSGRIGELRESNDLLNKMVKDKEQKLFDLNNSNEKLNKKYAIIKNKLKAYIDIEKKLNKENETLLSKLKAIEGNTIDNQRIDSSCICKSNDCELIKLKDLVNKLNKKCEFIEEERESLQVKYEDQKAVSLQYKNKLLNLEKNFKTVKETIKSCNESMHDNFIIEETQNLTQIKDLQNRGGLKKSKKTTIEVKDSRNKYKPSFLTEYNENKLKHTLLQQTSKANNKELMQNCKEGTVPIVFNKRAALLSPCNDYEEFSLGRRTIIRPISSIGKTTVNSTSICLV